MLRDFVCGENRKYAIGLGHTVASSLVGLITGGIITSIIWYVAIYTR